MMEWKMEWNSEHTQLQLTRYCLLVDYSMIYRFIDILLLFPVNIIAQLRPSTIKFLFWVARPTQFLALLLFFF